MSYTPHSVLSAACSCYQIMEFFVKPAIGSGCEARHTVIFFSLACCLFAASPSNPPRRPPPRRSPWLWPTTVTTTCNRGRPRWTSGGRLEDLPFVSKDFFHVQPTVGPVWSWSIERANFDAEGDAADTERRLHWICQSTPLGEEEEPRPNAVQMETKGLEARVMNGPRVSFRHR